MLVGNYDLSPYLISDAKFLLIFGYNIIAVR
jgi:hypothetical protein